MFSKYGITPGVSVDEPAQPLVRGSVLRGVFTDKKSPIAYGYDKADLPVYFNQTPRLHRGCRAGRENAVRPRVVMQFPANARRHPAVGLAGQRSAVGEPRAGRGRASRAAGTS